MVVAFKIISATSGKVLDVPNGSLDNGVQIQQWDDIGKPQQQWQLVDVGKGFVKIVSAVSGKVLDVPGGSLNNGVQIQQWDDNGNPQQQWVFVTNQERPMRGIENISLVKELSSPAVYLIVGDVKFWIVNIAEFEALGFDWNKVHVVDDGRLNGFTEGRLHTPLAIRPSDVFFDCGEEYHYLGQFYYPNCHPSASIVRKDVLVAGWLQAVPYVNVQYEPAAGVEDIHYNILLDADFLDRMYGSNGLSTALSKAVWPGNVPKGATGATPIPFATVPPATPGGPKGADFNSWMLPNNGPSLHCELNAWHTHTTGDFGLPSHHFIGRGDPPAFWVNPLQQDTDAWFPFNPPDPEGTGQPLQKGDYIMIRGTLWEDHFHDQPDEWNTELTYGHDGWLEIHPVDWVMRVRPPRLNTRLTANPVSYLVPPTGIGPIYIRPDFPDLLPPSHTWRQVRSVQKLIDTRITTITEANYSSKEIPYFNNDYLEVDITINPPGTKQVRFKATWLVGWCEIDSMDKVWVDDQPPPGAVLYGDGEEWDWSADNACFFGKKAHRSALVSGMHQHYFLGATSPMQVTSGDDTLFAMVYLDPDSPPDEVMLQWHTTNWLSRAYWGDNLIGWGTDGTADRLSMGPLPPTGEWVRLEVPASAVGLGHGTPQAPIAVDGMAFTLYGGRAIWDYAGVKHPDVKGAKEGTKEHKDKDKDKDRDKTPKDHEVPSPPPSSMVNQPALGRDELERKTDQSSPQLAAGQAFIRPEERPPVGEQALNQTQVREE